MKIPLTNVVEVPLLGVHLPRILVLRVLERENVGLSKLGVVVKLNLGVDGAHLPVPGLGERVDLHLRRVHGLEHGPQGADLIGRRVGQRSAKLEEINDLRHRLVAHRLAELQTEGSDLLGRLFRDGFDVDPAGRRDDENRPILTPFLRRGKFSH